MKLSSIALVLLLVGFASGCVQVSEKRPEQMPQVTAANEMAAITRLRSIANAEMAHQMDTGGQFGSLDDLVDKGLLGDPAKGKLSNYRFEIRVKSGGFEATAVPLQYGISGKRSFFVDESRIVRGATAKVTLPLHQIPRYEEGSQR
jgi:hypothetical protein